MNRTHRAQGRTGRGNGTLLKLCPILIALVAGCDFPGRPHASDRPIPEDQVVDFATLYGRNCAGCHGANGRLGPAPPLNDPTFLAIIPDETLLEVITDGRMETPMPAFAQENGGPLTVAQVKAIAEGIKPRWKKPDPSGIVPPPYSEEKGQADDTADRGKARGAQVFARACASCHGPRGEGKVDDDAGAGAINDRAFLSLISDDCLRRFVITGRPDLGMPNFAGKAGRPDDFRPLTSPEIADLVAFLASWRQGDGANSEATSAGRPEAIRPEKHRPIAKTAAAGRQ